MNSDFAAAFNRSPDWKWRRVMSIIKGDGAPATAYWDTENGYQWIIRALGFMKSYKRERNPMYNEELITLYGDIYTAYQMHEDNETHFRYELEAMILARVEREELAIRSDTTIAVITAYEELFFDVRSKLNSASSYIINYVIGPDLQNLRNDSYGPLWKFYGYKYGPEVLQAIILKCVNPQFALTPDSVGAQLNEDISGSFKVACSIASKMRGGGSHADRELLQMFTKMMEVDKMADMSSGSSKGQILEHIEAMVRPMMATVGGTVGYNPAVNPKVSGEPQFSEYIDLSVRGKSATFEEEQDFKFPQPKVKK